ncbi:MAG: FAD-dependent oxidoreductase, partial [Ferrimonas sp.]
KVALIGAGGIGFDMAEFLSESGPSASEDRALWLKQWGVNIHYQQGAGLVARDPSAFASAREIHLLQRKTSKLGKELGKTTGWIHRAVLNDRQVQMVSGVNYEKIDDEGLHVSQEGNHWILKVDHIVLCAGQESNRDLIAELEQSQQSYQLIGGAELAAELDAKRAIRQALEVAIAL